jgi:hypothetical protein
MMNRETTCVTVVLLLAGIGFLALGISTIVLTFALSLDPAFNDEPVLWDKVSIFVFPTSIVGILLILLGSNYFRRNKVYK